MNCTDNNPSAKVATAGERAERHRQLQRLRLTIYPDAILRTVCRPVEVFDSTVGDLVREMFELMRAHAGIGLAGPQVAVAQRVLVADLEGRRLCLTNPVIQDAYDPGCFDEGCLSLPGIRVSVLRPERIRVTGFDACGQRTSFGAVGLWARVIQHELDHLNGVLICDRGSPVGEQCAQCSLSLPATLIEERKQHSRHRIRRPTWPARLARPSPPYELPGGIL